MFIDQDLEFDNIKVTNLDSVSVNRDTNSDNELANTTYIKDSIGEGTIVRFNQTLENYLKVSVGNHIHHLTKFDKIHFADTKIFKYPNLGGYFLQN